MNRQPLISEAISQRSQRLEQAGVFQTPFLLASPEAFSSI